MWKSVSCTELLKRSQQITYKLCAYENKLILCSDFWVISKAFNYVYENNPKI